ncbi:MAG: tRNA (adenosine(37)-N6)-threonylcarbamoyltransferase complex ATPase subunit type 1 TsaE [Planctomycetaceae bacterium]|jgi:tRNA threonylcarbamoyladenosine biosynthesis protein TsaE|nr:tRNA (adenosine(37)-N6)-threonylcarbamoyltransferase complex ATPase subunit type 1 TsaE [Planctomycetaceae bacterium]
MTSIIFIAENLLDTQKLGAKLAETFPDGSVIALIGTLGAGKTRLVQAVAEASGVPKNTVSSPTFVLIHEYEEGDRPIYHFDAYRLEQESEFQSIGADEYFDGLGLSFVEWADRIPRALPAEHVTIEIEILSPESRRFTFSATGEKYVDFMNAMTAFIRLTSSNARET